MKTTRFLHAFALLVLAGQAAAQYPSQPVKVIVGEHDPALTPTMMQTTFLSTYPDCELEVMANAGHYPMHETPVALATSIENFLRR